MKFGQPTALLMVIDSSINTRHNMCWVLSIESDRDRLSQMLALLFVE